MKEGRAPLRVSEGRSQRQGLLSKSTGRLGEGCTPTPMGADRRWPPEGQLT